MSRIQTVKARQVFDSQGSPTVEVEVTTHEGLFRAITPSTDEQLDYAAHNLRDGDSNSFEGRSVQRAVENVNQEIAEAIIGMDPTDQEGIDQAMMDLDGGEDSRKSRLGANAILAVSMAVCRAGAAKKDTPLYKHINALAGNPTILMPVPCFNLINGGKHATNGLSIQEFCIMPTGSETYAEALQVGIEVYKTLGEILQKKYGASGASIGADGGYAPNIREDEEALKLIMEAVKASGFEDHVQLAIDIGASELFDPEEGKYDMASKRKGGKSSPGAMLRTDAEILRTYKLYAANYSVASIEDPFHREAWSSHAQMTGELGEVLQILGDDLIGGNADRIESSIEQSAVNGVVLKLDQIGTVSEAIAANSLARNAGMGVMVSHRTGDSEDPFIADLAAGLGTGQMKAGAPSKSEHMAKYNQLLRIEEDVDTEGAYAGDYWRDPWMMTPSGGGGHAYH